MSKHYPRVRIRAGYDHIVVREGLSFTFFMRRPREEVVPGVLRALEAYLRAIGPQTLGWYTDDEGEYFKLDEPGWERIQRELRERRFPIIQLYDASLTERRYRFEYHGKDLAAPTMVDEPHAVCAATFWLPTEFLEEHGPGRVHELALELATPLPFCSGLGGLSLNGELDLVGVSKELSEVCLRHPGIDVPDLNNHSWTVGTRVRGPQWLTFLGQPVLGALGGPAALRSCLHSPETAVQEMGDDKALITLGEWPEAGDISRGDSLPAYRELARVLEPWLFHEPRGLMLDFGPEETRRWERRFLD
ncbi:MAG: DUF3396 domain-containing protein [Myxococcaceae bacterium]|nr:DUF3396 domain-containing protein [Myxococcaceae bacterium]